MEYMQEETLTKDLHELHSLSNPYDLSDPVLFYLSS